MTDSGGSGSVTGSAGGEELEEDLGGGRGLTAALDEFDGAVEINLIASGEPFSEPERVLRLDQDMESPGLNLGSFALLLLYYFLCGGHEKPLPCDGTKNPRTPPGDCQG